MRKFAPKAIFSILTVRKTAADKPRWDRFVLILSTAVTLGLAALYAYEKATSHW